VYSISPYFSFHGLLCASLVVKKALTSDLLIIFAGVISRFNPFVCEIIVNASDTQQLMTPVRGKSGVDHTIVWLSNNAGSRIVLHNNHHQQSEIMFVAHASNNTWVTVTAVN